MSGIRQVVIVGSKGHALSVLDACDSVGLEPVLILDKNSDLNEAHGIPIVSELSQLKSYEPAFVLGVGSNFLREAAFNEIRREVPKSVFPVVAHKTSWVSSRAELAEGTIVLANANVGPNARTGIGALLNTGSSLDHDGVLGDFASLGPGANSAGGVRIGARTMVGLNVGITHGVCIGDDTVVGAQSLVRKDIPSFVVAFGVPCKVIRHRHSNDPYY